MYRGFFFDVPASSGLRRLRRLWKTN